MAPFVGALLNSNFEVSCQSYLSKHGGQLLVGVVVAALREVVLDLVSDLRLVEMPDVLVVGVRSGRRIRSSGDPVDLGSLLQDLVGQPLRRRQHLGVVLRDEVLHELLQLLPVHLKQGL